MIKDVREARFLQRKVQIPDEYRISTLEVRTPIVSDQIQRLVASLTENQPSFHFPPPTPGDPGERRASHLEHAATELWRRLSEDAGQDLYYKFVDGQASRGAGILKVVLRPDRWDQKPDRGQIVNDDGKVEDVDEDADEYLKRVAEFKKGAKLPIAARVVARDTYYPKKDEDGLYRVLEITRRTVDQVYSDFGRDAGKAFNTIGLPIPEDANYDGAKEVSFIEYWDREWCVYVVSTGIQRGGGTDYSRAVVRAFKHGYGRPPYFEALGEESSEEDPNFESVPSAYPIIYLSAYLDTIYTQLGNLGYLTGWPSMKEVAKAGEGGNASLEEDADEEQPSYKIKPGTVLRPPPGSDIEPINWGVSLGGLTGMAGEVRQMAQSSQLPAIMSGIPPGSRTAGYAINELTNAAKSKYQRLVNNAKITIGEFMNFCLWLVEHKVREPVYLLHDKVDAKTTRKYQDWLELKPADIRGYYRCQVQIQPRSPVDRMQESIHMSNMKAAGAATTREVIEARGHPQPDEVLDEILIEEMLAEPQIRDWMKREALKEAGLLAQVEEIQAQAQVLAQQAGMATGNGQAAGVMTPGEPAITADVAPGQMDAPGMPAGAPGPMPNNVGPLPGRQYTAKRGMGRPPGVPSMQPNRPGIEGFRSR